MVKQIPWLDVDADKEEVDAYRKCSSGPAYIEGLFGNVRKTLTDFQMAVLVMETKTFPDDWKRIDELRRNLNVLLEKLHQAQEDLPKNRETYLRLRTARLKEQARKLCGEAPQDSEDS